MIEPETWKAIREGSVAAWSAVGPLIGVLVGAYIANRNQRRQWLLDNRKQEYRELLSALSSAFIALTRLNTPMIAIPGELERELRNAETESFRILRDRLFIATEIRDTRILGLWLEATRDVDHDRDLVKFADRFNQINKTIVYLATGSAGGAP